MYTKRVYKNGVGPPPHKKVQQVHKTNKTGVIAHFEKKAHQKVVSMGKGEPVGETNRSCSDKQTDRYGIDLSLDITSTTKEVPSCSSGEVPYNLGSDDSQEVQKVLQIQLWIPRKDNRIVETNCLELLVNMADIEVLDCKPSLFGDLVLTISGTQQNCLAAERIVLMTVDKKYIGLIIGKGGRSIREIRNKFGVSVEIIQHKALDNVILTGAQLPVKKAMKYIIHITSCY